MTPTTEITDWLGTLTSRGITAVVAPSGKLQLRPASRLVHDDREWLRQHAGELIEHLRRIASGGPIGSLTPEQVCPTGKEPWDTPTALALMEKADSLVELLGVEGRQPDIQAAVALVTSVHPKEDMAALRSAVSRFEATVRSAATDGNAQASAERAGDSRCETQK